MSHGQNHTSAQHPVFTLEQADQLALAAVEYLAHVSEQYQLSDYDQGDAGTTTPTQWLASHYPQLLPYKSTFARVLLGALRGTPNTSQPGQVTP